MGKLCAEPSDRSSTEQKSEPGPSSRRFTSYSRCRCCTAMSSPGITRSGLVAKIAAANESAGEKTWELLRSRTALVLNIGWPGGQTASTRKPALANATASRAVGYHLYVVATSAVGFTSADLSNRNRYLPTNLAYASRWNPEYSGLKIDRTGTRYLNSDKS